VGRRVWANIVGVVLGWAWIGPSHFGLTPIQAADLQTIRQRGHLIVAVKDNLRPLGFRDEQGQLEGLEIDLAHRLAADLLGKADAVVLRPVANQDRLTALLNDEVDIVIARMTATGPRARLVDFSVPYYQDGTALITRNANLQRLSDLGTQPLAILNGSSTIAELRAVLPDANLFAVDSYADAFQQLETGQAIAFAADASLLSGWMQEHPEYHLLPGLMSSEALCIAMPKGLQYDELRRQIDTAILRWQKEGWLQERIAYWGLAH
jgi:polar amino acid transport system substrate-binding protein